MSNQAEVEALVNQALAQQSGPLFTAMQLMIADIYASYNQLFPAPVISVNLFPGGALNPTSTVTNFVASLQPNNLHLTWTAVTGALNYEIRVGTTSDTWDSASFLLQTGSLQADISPYTIPLVYGTYVFFIKAIDASGTYSGTANSLQILIAQIPGPIASSSVVGNNVLLRWSIPSSSLQIDHYLIFRNGISIGQINGTFDVIFETTAGAYNYTIEAVDIIGNISTPSNTISVTLGNPTDFSLFATVASTFRGNKVNCALDTDGALFCVIDTQKTWAAHFADNGWVTIQNQIDAGYEKYFEPGP